MDVESLKSRITSRTKAVIVTQLWGLCGDMDEINAVAREHNLTVIEDCAHAIYATYKGGYAGTLGDIGVYSFQMSKQMGLGDAGMVVCKQAEHRQEIHEMLTFGTIPPRIGWNYRINEVVSAIGIVQLQRARHYVDICIESAGHYSEAVKGFEHLVTPQFVPADRVNTYHIWTGLFEGDKVGVDYEAFKQAHFDAGIHFNFGYIEKPAYLHPSISEPIGYGKGCPRTCPFADRNPVYAEGDCPQAEDMMPRLMLTGTGGNPDDHKRVAEKWRGVLERFA
jgi:perosamine synthetase